MGTWSWHPLLGRSNCPIVSRRRGSYLTRMPGLWKSFAWSPRGAAGSTWSGTWRPERSTVLSDPAGWLCTLPGRMMGPPPYRPDAGSLQRSVDSSTHRPANPARRLSNPAILFFSPAKWMMGPLVTGSAERSDRILPEAGISNHWYGNTAERLDGVYRPCWCLPDGLWYSADRPTHPGHRMMMTSDTGTGPLTEDMFAAVGFSLTMGNRLPAAVRRSMESHPAFEWSPSSE